MAGCVTQDGTENRDDEPVEQSIPRGQIFKFVNQSFVFDAVSDHLTGGESGIQIPLHAELTFNLSAIDKGGEHRTSHRLRVWSELGSWEEDRFGRFNYWFNDDFLVWRLDDMCGRSQSKQCLPVIHFVEERPLPLGIGYPLWYGGEWGDKNESFRIDYLDTYNVESKFVGGYYFANATIHYDVAGIVPTSVQGNFSHWHHNIKLISSQGPSFTVTSLNTSVIPPTPISALSLEAPFPGATQPLYGTEATFAGAFSHIEAQPTAGAALREGCLRIAKAHPAQNSSVLETDLPIRGLQFDFYINHDEKLKLFKVLYSNIGGYRLDSESIRAEEPYECSKYVGHFQANYSIFHNWVMPLLEHEVVGIVIGYGGSLENQATYTPFYSIGFETQPQDAYWLEENFGLDASTGYLWDIALDEPLYAQID